MIYATEPKRNPLHYALAGASLMGFLTIPAQLVENYVAPEPHAQVSPAPIWSKKCEAQGKPFIAKQADGGKWVVVCLNDGVRI